MRVLSQNFFPNQTSARMLEKLWRVSVFTDENGGKFYHLNIRAEDSHTAEKKAMREVQFVFALIRPLVRVLWAHTEPKGRSDNDESS